MNALEKMGWFEEEKIGYNLLWDPSLTAIETTLYLFLEDRLKRPYKTNLFMSPQLMILLWRRKMVKEADLLFTIPVGIPFWGS